MPPTPSLPEPVRSGTAAVNGIKLWYAVFGQGEPVVLVHGGLANSDYWGLRGPMAKRYQVVVLDSRGHGRSTRTETPIGYDLMASDVLALMDELKGSEGGPGGLERRGDPSGSISRSTIPSG